MEFLFDNEKIEISVPDDSVVYESSFPSVGLTDAEIVGNAILNPLGALKLAARLKQRRSGKVVIVVSDITRPIPYSNFIQQLLAYIEFVGVKKDEIVILIATGMHRVSTYSERIEMFGKDIADNYTIIDHDAENDSELVELPGARSFSGNKIKLNRHFVEAGFRIITGLVEPHFMAGFSGGRKSVCPGLSSLGTVQNFHGYNFLANANARNGNLKDNPLHEEALSVAKAVGIDFSLNVILNKNRKIVRAFAGELESAHFEACKFVAEYVCRKVDIQADVAITSSGGYPLDATFYQCVKGMVSCLPAVKKGGAILSFGGCSEAIGSREYKETMFKYADNWQRFLEDIKSGIFIKDQWEFQMQCRALDKVGRDGLFFVTDKIPQEDLDKLSVNGISTDNVQHELQKLVDNFIAKGATFAVFPEGPYCAPLSQD